MNGIFTNAGSFRYVLYHDITRDHAVFSSGRTSCYSKVDSPSIFAVKFVDATYSEDPRRRKSTQQV